MQLASVSEDLDGDDAIQRRLEYTEYKLASVTSDVDEYDRRWCTGERSPEGFFVIKDGVAAWAQSVQTEKIDASWQQVRVAGFPTAFRIELDSAALRDGAVSPSRFQSGWEGRNRIQR